MLTFKRGLFKKGPRELFGSHRWLTWLGGQNPFKLGNPSIRFGELGWQLGKIGETFLGFIKTGDFGILGRKGLLFGCGINSREVVDLNILKWF